MSGVLFDLGDAASVSICHTPGTSFAAATTTHIKSRNIEGAAEPLRLPLCWDMEGRQRGATDDEWMLSWDHDVIDPGELFFVIKGEPTCRDCLEWLHA